MCLHSTKYRQPFYNDVSVIAVSYRHFSSHVNENQGNSRPPVKARSQKLGRIHSRDHRNRILLLAIDRYPCQRDLNLNIPSPTHGELPRGGGDVPATQISLGGGARHASLIGRVGGVIPVRLMQQSHLRRC